MSNLSMSQIMQQMQQVNEPGLGNAQSIKEAKTSRLSNEKNSLSNAVMAYEKMTGKDRLQEEAGRKEGAMKVMTEIFNSDENVDLKIDKLKKVLSHL